jgi:hypothetical protein
VAWSVLVDYANLRLAKDATPSDGQFKKAMAAAKSLGAEGMKRMIADHQTNQQTAADLQTAEEPT